MELFDVVMPSKKAFNLEDYSRDCKGLLLAMNSREEVIGYVQLLSGEYYYFTTNNGEDYGTYDSISDILDSNSNISEFKLLKINGDKSN